jgi:hypothetical protein
MPTNLPPDYFKVEAQYRAAKTDEEKLVYLEQMFSIVPKHKGTDHLRADLRRRISELRSPERKQKGPSRQVSAFHIDKEGAGQVAMIGAPNVGKSALMTALTNATPEVAPYPFTTWTPTPGMMPIDNIQVQLIDTPPLSEEHIEPDLMSLIRRVDLLLLVVDLQAYPIEQLEDTLALLEAYHIAPSHRRAHYDEPFRWRFIPTLVLANKVDDAALDEDFQVLCELLDEDWTILPISAESGRYFDQLKWAVFEHLEIIRVYAKPPGKKADLSAPFVMRRGGTVEEFAGHVHRDFLQKLQSARIWGEGVYDGQPVSREHVLHDGDIVELRVS